MGVVGLGAEVGEGAEVDPGASVGITTAVLCTTVVGVTWAVAVGDDSVEGVSSPPQATARVSTTIAKIAAQK